ncbi:MAG: hypothetical protein ACH37H_16200 [Ilumatobacteraceae bacterium]|jgi:hypothetical protein|nr:hypothetical protein [Ilumatobacteraceae bacterium]HQY15852.1 hypothetical protein [Ilumatobacteraceae bacterium]HQY85682.1 hypothetical protein [Ilumatobacteraceae bacterium]HRC48980.1 hypothetical protein [Ilumatobacteraceae bacterium]
MRSLRRTASTLALLGLLAIAGCGSGSDASTAAGGAEGVPAVLNFSAPLVGGGEFSGAAMAGRPVAFWFWAPT